MPLVSPKTGRNYFCGRGPARESCPSGSSCTVHPTDAYAVCCPGILFVLFLLNVATGTRIQI